MISRRMIAVLIVLICFMSYSESIAGPTGEEEINNVLTVAESLFKAMNTKQYPEIWRLITAKTKKSIVDSTFKELKKSGTETRREKIEIDFQNGDALSQAYWGAYLFIFDPEMVLQQSKWTIGRMERDKADIKILFKKSANPAILQLFRENNEWKVGLHETFGSRNMTLF
jgi:hypothetical protein